MHIPLVTFLHDKESLLKEKNLTNVKQPLKYCTSE